MIDAHTLQGVASAHMVDVEDAGGINPWLVQRGIDGDGLIVSAGLYTLPGLKQLRDGGDDQRILTIAFSVGFGLGLDLGRKTELTL